MRQARRVLQTIILGLCALVISACLRGSPQTVINMEFRPVEAGLRLDIEFSKPVSSYVFFGDFLDAQAPDWNVLTEDLELSGFTLSHPDAQRFVKASILIRPQTQFDLSELFVITSIGEKGFLIIPDMFEDTDPDTVAQIRFAQTDDYVALERRGLLMGDAPYIREAVVPLGMPFVYYGPRGTVNSDMTRIVAPDNPDWIDPLINKTEEAAWDFFSALYPDYPAPRPLSIIGGFPDDAPYDYLGLTTLKGVIAYWTDYEIYTPDTPKTRADIEHLAAHETAHLWIGAAFHPSEPIARRWLFEGLADYLAWKFVTQNDRDQFLQHSTESINNCIAYLGGRALDAIIPTGYTDIYECGLTLQVLLDAGEFVNAGGAADGLALWQDILTEASSVRRILDWQDYQMLMANSAIGNDRAAVIRQMFGRQHRLSWRHVLLAMQSRSNAADTRAAIRLFLTDTGSARWADLPERLAPLGITALSDGVDETSPEDILRRFSSAVYLDDCDAAPDHARFDGKQLWLSWIPMDDDCPAEIGPISKIDDRDLDGSPKRLLRTLRKACRKGWSHNIDITMARPKNTSENTDSKADSDDAASDTDDAEGMHLHCRSAEALRAYRYKFYYTAPKPIDASAQLP